MAAGRNGKYESHVKPKLERIRMMRQSGYTEEAIYTYCGVSHEAFARYKRDHVELIEVLKESTDELILKLEDTLFKKALGGDITALLFSLKNLAPQRWADKQQVQLSGDVVTTVEPSFTDTFKEQMKKRHEETAKQ